jgi:hypothetical protein
MEAEYDYLKEIHEKLKKEFGNSFCFAKWYHANIYLQTGETHSCYHPAPHPIPLETIQKQPSALHNTPQKYLERAKMLTSERPSGCQYCWNIEDLQPELISDRQIRSGSIYREQLVEEVKNLGATKPVVPDYIELSFGNECNFACGYCHPKSSSRFQNEIKKFGKFTNVSGHDCDIQDLKIYSEENNPYLEAWWKWWPELRDRLHILRITGGEPLIQKSTKKILTLLDAQPMPNLHLKVNSNLGASPQIVADFTGSIARLHAEKKILDFELFTSMDAWGPRAEYIRHGLNTEIFEKNLLTFLTNTNFPVTIMITFQLFSVQGVEQLFGKILEWRKKFPHFLPDGKHRIRFDLSYLKEPLQYDMHLLPKETYGPILARSLHFIEKNLEDSNPAAFSFMDLQRMKRLYLYFCTNPYEAEKIQKGRQDFAAYFSQLDERRNRNHRAVFPELREFFDLCEGQQSRFRLPKLFASLRNSL